MRTTLRPAFVLLSIFMLILGVLYPLFLTEIGHEFFPFQTTGSLVVQSHQVVGSRLIGQNFTDPAYFWGRPSATNGVPYNALASGGSNLGPLNPVLWNTVRQRVSALTQSNPQSVDVKFIPVDLVTASASGLDPDMSLASAYYQASRIAAVRHVTIDSVNAVIHSHSLSRQWGVFGEKRINVLELNILLDEQFPRRSSGE